MASAHEREGNPMPDIRDMTIREIEREYLDDVRSIAEEAAEMPEDERDDYIHETVDGNEWVVYTFRAMLVPIVSPNEDAYERDFGGQPDGDMKESQIAYAAMRADVEEEVSRIIDER